MLNDIWKLWCKISATIVIIIMALALGIMIGTVLFFTGLIGGICGIFTLMVIIGALYNFFNYVLKD